MLTTKRLIMRFIETCGGFKALQWYNRTTPLVLMYHRIIDKPFIYGLSPLEFEKQIAYITKRFRVVSIDTLVEEIKQGAVKPYTIALTFDDGHYDFYENAWPILKKYNVPASLYITTAFVDGTRWLWPDLLKYTLLNTAVSQINMPNLGTLSLTPKDLQKTWHILGDHCLTLSISERMECIHAFANAAHVELPDSPAPPFHAVTWKQLIEMQHEGLIIGSHTVSHPILSGLTTAEIRDELFESADAIKNKVGYFPKGICYPNGRLSDINDDVLAQAKNIGYEYGLLACNTEITSSEIFLMGRLSTDSDFDYFRWTLCRRPLKQHSHYIS